MLLEARLNAIFVEARKRCLNRQFSEAESLCRKILLLFAEHAPATLLLAELLVQRGEYDNAISILDPLLRTAGLSPAVQFSIGNAYHHAGRLLEAACSLRRALQLQQNFPQAQNNLGVVLWRLGDHVGAVEAFKKAIALENHFIDARLNLADFLLHKSRNDEAVAELRAAVSIDPFLAITHHRLGVALQRQRHYQASLKCQLRAISLEPNIVEAYVAAGMCMCSLGDAASALPMIDRALGLESDRAETWHALGLSLKALGRFSDAAEAYEKAVAIDPDHGEAHRGLASVRKQLGENTFEQLHQIACDDSQRSDNRSSAALALARRLEDAEHFDAAFEAATSANALARAEQISRDVIFHKEVLIKRNIEAMRLFTTEYFKHHVNWGVASELPVFIVGYPRSGTTLVEQICCSHSGVYGAGELPDVGQLSRTWRSAEGIYQCWEQEKIEAIADAYLENLTTLAPGASRVIDKAPDNIFELGIIALLFPNSRVIFCHRDGRDASLSVFFNRFGRNAAFATDLVDAGKQWHETERIASHWQRVLPLRMHNVQYENLVTDFENEASKLIDFLGLAWEATCLDFHMTERTIMTPSSWQVRQPLYSTSVGRWRNYRSHIEQLCEAIEVPLNAPDGAVPVDLRIT